jgi:hypothetical protein
MDRGWTWLGDRCPGERVRSQRVPMTKHHYLYVAPVVPNEKWADGVSSDRPRS